MDLLIHGHWTEPYLAYTVHMERARISQIRDHLSRYLDRVREGGEVLILDRNRPIARIVPAGGGRSAVPADAERLEELERRGLIRRGRGRLPPAVSKGQPVKVRGSALADLLEERRSGW